MEEELIQNAVLDAIQTIASCTDDDLSLHAIAKPKILDYIDRYHQTVAKIITGFQKEKQLEYIKGLVMFYPVSAKILDDIFNDEFNKANFGNEDFSENISEWFDITETMQKHFRRMISSMRKVSFDSLNSQLIDEIQDYEAERKEQKKERDRLIELQKEKYGIIRELDGLKREIEELRSNTSDEELKRRKEELQAERNSIVKKSKENEEELNRLKEELENIGNPDNQKFNKALKELSKVIATLPDDEAD